MLALTQVLSNLLYHQERQTEWEVRGMEMATERENEIKADEIKANDEIKEIEEQPAVWDEVLKLAQALMPEPPSATLKRAVAVGERELAELGWKAYDSVVEMANSATDRLYTSPAVGQVLGRSIDIVLRWQRFNNSLAGALFGALWPSVGLPTAAEVEGVRTDIRALREELREAVIDRETRDEFAGELSEVVRESIVSAKPAGARRKNGFVSQWPWMPADTSEGIEDVGN